jgi:hypothetical protein
MYKRKIFKTSVVDRNMKRLFILLVVLFSFSFALAAENLTQQQIAQNCLNSSRLIIDGLNQTNISPIRFEDMYSKAESLYSAQSIVLERSKKADFKTIILYCDQIVELRETATEAIDSFSVFLSFYNETINRNMDTTSIDKIVSQISGEISGERYENVLALIDEGYKQVGIVRSEQTALALAYSATAKRLKDFVIQNWLEILIVFCVLLAFYLFYRTKISLWILERKLKLLNIRRESLRKLLGDTQKLYFQDGKISDNDYRVRVKNFSDLVRDIDRQIPMVQADIAKYSIRQKENEARNKKKR